MITKQHSHDATRNEHHQWDRFGNPTGDGNETRNDRLTRYHPYRYQYDTSGNQTHAKGPGCEQQRRYNGFNQPIPLNTGIELIG